MPWDTTKPAGTDPLSLGDDLIRSDKQHLTSRIGGFLVEENLGRVYQVGNDLYIASNAEFDGSAWYRVDPTKGAQRLGLVSGGVICHKVGAGSGQIQWELGEVFVSSSTDPDSMIPRSRLVIQSSGSQDPDISLTTSYQTVSSVVIPSGRLSGGEEVRAFFVVRVRNTTGSLIALNYQILVGSTVLFSANASIAANSTENYVRPMLRCAARGGGTLSCVGYVGPLTPSTSLSGSLLAGFNNVSVNYSSDIQISLQMNGSAGGLVATPLFRHLSAVL